VLLLVRAAHQLQATILARLRRKVRGAQLTECGQAAECPVLCQMTPLDFSGGTCSVSRKMPRGSWGHDQCMRNQLARHGLGHQALEVNSSKLEALRTWALNCLSSVASKRCQSISLHAIAHLFVALQLVAVDAAARLRHQHPPAGATPYITLPEALERSHLTAQHPVHCKALAPASLCAGQAHWRFGKTLCTTLIRLCRWQALGETAEEL